MLGTQFLSGASPFLISAVTSYGWGHPLWDFRGNGSRFLELPIFVQSWSGLQRKMSVLASRWHGQSDGKETKECLCQPSLLHVTCIFFGTNGTNSNAKILRGRWLPNPTTSGCSCLSDPGLPGRAQMASIISLPPVSWQIEDDSWFSGLSKYIPSGKLT
jgi:hypothetical protein